MKKLLSALFIIVFTLSLFGCKSHCEYKDGTILKASISISGWSMAAYIFELKETKDLLITKGIGYLYNNRTNEFSRYDPPYPGESFEEKTVQLSDKNFDEIISILGKMKPLDKNQEIEVYDSWECFLTYNENYTQFSFGLANDINCNKLIDKLISLSPMEIVDDQGYKPTQ